MKQTFQAPQPLILRIKKARVIPFFLFLEEVPHPFTTVPWENKIGWYPFRVLNATRLTM
jgi:hypothetical protein